MKARLNIMEAMRKHAAVLKDSASGEEATEAALLERELSERINSLRFSASPKGPADTKGGTPEKGGQA